MKYVVRIGGQEYVVDAKWNARDVEIQVGEQKFSIRMGAPVPGFAWADIGGKRVEFGWDRRDNRYVVTVDQVGYEVQVGRPGAAGISGDTQVLRGRHTEVKAPLPGMVREVFVKVGSKVRKGDPLLTLEAMKLENEIQSPTDGVVRGILVRPGQPVEKSVPLVSFE